MGQALINSRLFHGGLDLSGHLNAMSLEYGAEMLDATTYGNTTRINAGGVKSLVVAHEGYWSAVPDAALFAGVGLGPVPVTICPVDAADGALAYLFQAVQSEYTPGAAHGELLAFGVTMEGAGGTPLVRGLILHPETAVDESDDGTGRQLGAVVEGKSLYAALHVLDASDNDTLDVEIESASSGAFSSPTTRIAFAQATAKGSEWKSVAGPITHTHYRVTFTIGGTAPSFSFIVAAGIF